MSRRKKQVKTTTLPQTDPYVARETEKYQKPIPSREYIMMALAEYGKPLSLADIAQLLQLSTEEDLEALRRRLKAMERDGQAIRNRRKEYGLAKKMNLVRGRVIAHPDGYGFVVPDEDKEAGDVFLSEQQMRSLMHSDRVLVNIIGVDYRGRREGTLVEILNRGIQQIVGKYGSKQGIAFVEPDNRRFSQRVLISQLPEVEIAHGQ
ncbi:MAG: winged-helix domain-containing protein, partial [Thiotrichaceae bacterium]